MTGHANRTMWVYWGLVAATLLVTGLSSGWAHELLTSKGAVAIATGVAFVKARFVMLDFMELRGTAMQGAFDIWLLVVGAASAGLLLF